MAAKALICPGCRTEYRAGFTTCAECGRLLVDATHLAPPRPLGDSIHEVVVARYQGQPEAEMWAELLRHEGIPTWEKLNDGDTCGRGSPVTSRPSELTDQPRSAREAPRRSGPATLAIMVALVLGW